MSSKHHIHPTSVVEEYVHIAEGVRIGAYCVIGYSERGEHDPTQRIVIGTDTVVGPHSVLYDDVSIESHVVLDPFSRVGPHAHIGARTHLLYGARVHEHVEIGSDCSIQGNCPDRTTFGDHVIHLGRIAHSYYSPFADWDTPEEPGPTLESFIVVGAHALLIGPIHIGSNTFILPGEVVRTDLPGDGIFQGGRWHSMPNWATYLRILKKLDWVPGSNHFV